jgi:nucleotidyltransferase/DNA polymerase involved in DNA repair
VEVEKAVVCVAIPHFALRVLTHGTAEWDSPLALVSSLDSQSVVRDANPAARAQGVEEGMPVTRAYGICPGVTVVDLDQIRVDVAYDHMLTRLEDIGAAVVPEGYGLALFDAAPLRGLYKNVSGVVAKTRAAFREGTDLRVGVASSMYLAKIAAQLAPERGIRAIAPGDQQAMLRRMPLQYLDVNEALLDTWSALGIRTCGDLAAIGRTHVADRFGEDGDRFWLLANGEERRVLCPRVPVESVEESMDFPEPLGNLQVWQQAVRKLVERLTARGDMQHYALRSITVRAHLVTGTSWQQRKALREPTLNADRISLAAIQPLQEIPAPVERFVVTCDQLVPAPIDQLSIERSWRANSNRDGIRHVQELVGDEALLQVFELDPASRIPEHRSMLIPARSDGAA